MGSLNGEYYGAWADNQIYLTITDSNNTTGAICGTIKNYGTTSPVTGTYTITSQYADIMLTASGPTNEIWNLRTYDYNVLSGTRYKMGQLGAVPETIGGLGRTR
ncbi:hypothetical protein [Pseudomonas fluorescens]|uniref:Uncharacterized protein n=1 Tax=Pseudomonas fluorescens TaxID=294 RepID=A0A5E7MY79_PSEFL|nr:hypothetical protein [Pseudomonas fluorescens]VVP29815.1 hypothetical protein PS880_04280 [Pseudomonas fluorescens]